MDYLEKARRVIRLEIAELNRLLNRVGEPFGQGRERGQDLERPLNLQAGTCYAFASLGGPGASDTDLYILSGQGEALEQDRSTSVDAVVRFCPPASGLYQLRANMYAGQGPIFIAGYMQTAQQNVAVTPTPVTPVIGETLEAAIAEDRHVPLLDEMVIWIARLVRTNEDLIRNMVHDRSGGFMRFTGLDAPLAGKIIDAIDKLLSELAMDPDHPLRAKIEDSLRELAGKLRNDPATQERVQQMKVDLLANPAVEQWWLGVWERGRAGLLRAVRDPDSALAGEMGALLRQFGEALIENPDFRRGINRFVRRAAVGAAADYGDGIVKLVSDTVRRWDAKTISDRVENAVGRDLQFIRINGTVVGGLVGLTIHTIETLAR